MMEKEEKKAKEAVAMEKDFSEKNGHGNGERQPLHYDDDAEEAWVGQQGIEMRRAAPRRALSDDETIS